MAKKAADTATAAAERAAARMTSRIAIWVLPFVVALIELLAVTVLWWQWQGTVLVGAAAATSTLACGWVVWHAGRNRTEFGRLHGLATTGLVGIHVIWSTQVGPFQKPLIDVWLWAAITLSLTWGIRLHVAVGAEPGEGARNVWDRSTERAGIQGRFRPREITGERASGPLQLEPGVTVDDAQKARESWASALGVPKNGVRMVEDPDDASRAEVTVVRRDLLRQKLAYVGPEHAGDSAALPVRIGIYEVGDRAMLPMSVPGLGEAHLLVQGMNGSGKTAGAGMLMAGRFERTDVFTIVIDTVKGAQSLGPWLHGLRWVERKEARVRALFEAVLERTVPYRADYLGRRGLDKWQAGCGIPRLDLHIEEGAGLLVSNGDFVRIMERCRSVGIHITASLQRASWSAMDVAARQQFSTVLCFGQKDEEDARFSLPDEVVDAGADPSLWKNNNPGYAYLVGPGVPRTLWTTPLRTEHIQVADLEILGHYAARNGMPLDEGTIDTLRDLWDTRDPIADIIASLSGYTALTPAAATATAPVPGKTVALTHPRPPAPTTTSSNTQFEDERMDEREVDAMYDELPDDERPTRWVPADDDDPELAGLDDDELGTDLDDVDIDEELKELEVEIVFGEPADHRQRMTDDQARDAFLTRLAELQAGGVEEFKGTEFRDVQVAAGRSVAWIYSKLTQQIKLGQLERTDNGFKFVQRQALAGASR